MRSIVGAFFESTWDAHPTAGAATEGECKQIQQKSKQIGISIGEFTKAILKINNIANEFDKICTIQGNMKLLEAIKQSPQLTLKSIATNQSLYL